MLSFTTFYRNLLCGKITIKLLTGGENVNYHFISVSFIIVINVILQKRDVDVHAITKMKLIIFILLSNKCGPINGK